MDKASFTIDRHTPKIPESLWSGLTPDLERVMTKVKNRLILPSCKIEEVVQWREKCGNKFPPAARKEITDDILKRGENAAKEAQGKLGDIKSHLARRGVTDKEIERYQICSTAEVVKNLDEEAIDNLSLRIPHKFDDLVSTNEIEGISIPCYFEGNFYGFATRILNEKAVKYTFSVPHRLCFGVDLTKKDEVYIVEGVFDSIAMHYLGYNALGMGDSQPNYFKMLIASRFKKVNLLFDNDYAGFVGAIKAFIILDQMLQKGNVEILVPNGDEPEKLIRDTGQLSFSKITFEDAVIRSQELGQNLQTEEILL